MVPGRNRGGGLVDVPGPVLVLEKVLEPPGESTVGVDWLMVITGFELGFGPAGFK